MWKELAFANRPKVVAPICATAYVDDAHPNLEPTQILKRGHRRILFP
jgi:hypothetical protein